MFLSKGVDCDSLSMFTMQRDDQHSQDASTGSQKRHSMDKARDVAVILGSLRKDSINRKVANALAELAPATLKLSIVEIGHLPIYNQDGDENPPAAWREIRERIRAADAVVFVTPEHNRSVPTALKNAMDIGSRPYGKNAWDGKPGRWSAHRRVASAGSAPTITCGSRSFF
jgi:NAD(P)H-dependent FMN reductase